VRLRKTVVTDKPLGKVFDYLSDFTTTTDWDPGTVATVRQRGDGGIGTVYLNTSEFLGRKTELSYVVQEFVPGERIRLRGENKTVTSVDTMTFLAAGTGPR
jgi:Polyketide cyclase / dehydrase and lipid transport